MRSAGDEGRQRPEPLLFAARIPKLESVMRIGTGLLDSLFRRIFNDDIPSGVFDGMMALI